MGPQTIPAYIVALDLASACIAMLVAVVLLVLHRSYGRGYLRDWGFSWMAAASKTVIGLAAFYAAPRIGGFRYVFTLAGQTAGYWLIAFLAFGAHEIATGSAVGGRRRHVVLWVLAAVAALTAIVRTVGTVQQRMLIGVGAMSMAQALVFVVAGVMVWRSRVWQVSFGRRLVGVALVVAGLDAFRLTLETLGRSPFAGTLQLAHSAVLSGIVSALSMIVAVAVGTGVLAGLLAEERARGLRAADELHHLSFFDPLSRLPNRRLFLDHIRLSLARAERGASSVAVLVVNLDRFTTLNNALGRTGGDALLRAVGERLARAVRRGDTVARLGGDVFGVLVDDLDGAAGARIHAEAVLTVLRQPFQLPARDVVTTASIGVSIGPGDSAEADALLRNAEQAAWYARQQGRNRWEAYRPELDDRADERVAFEHAVRQAVVHGNLEVYYQPISSPKNQGRIIRVEALVRWPDAQRGLVEPTAFVPVAERLGIGDVLDLHVLRVAAAQTQAWRSMLAPDLSVAVNLCARTFYHPELVARIAAVLEDTGLPAQALHLEITETVAMEDASRTLEVLGALRRLGVALGIDDFGTGHSSLAYLRDYPIDELKLDRSFVRDLASAPDAAAISAAVIALSHSLHIEVVAEGVETEEQRTLLVGQGCDQLQGFLIGRPEPADACGRRLGAATAGAPDRL